MWRNFLFSFITRALLIGIPLSFAFHIYACESDLALFPGGEAGFVLFTGLTFTTVYLFLNAIIAIKIRNISRILGRMADGDLAQEFRNGIPDEVGQCVRKLGKMRDSWGAVFDAILPLSVDIDSISRELKNSAGRTHSQAIQLTGRAEETAAASRQLSSSVQETTKKAGQVSSVTENVIEKVHLSRELATRSIESMNALSSTIDRLARVVSELNEGMGEINSIVEMIQTIAARTNLLALNAAIEAARAGGAGGRFAVVSDEVRKLAENTLKATEEINQRMDRILKTSEQTSEMMGLAVSGNVKTSDEIRSLVDELSDMLDSVQTTGKDISSISNLMEQESSTSDSVTRSMLDSLESARSIEKETEAVNDSVSNLTSVVDRLRESTMGLKTLGSRLLILDLARTDHRIFVSKIDEHCTNQIHLEEGDITDHFNCRLGKWYYGDGQKEAGDLPSFVAIENPHAEIHKVARETIQAKNAGDTEKAAQLQEKLHGISGIIQEKLIQLKEDYREKLK